MEAVTKAAVGPPAQRIPVFPKSGMPLAWPQSLLHADEQKPVFKGMQSCGPLLLCGPCTARPHREPFLQA